MKLSNLFYVSQWDVAYRKNESEDLLDSLLKKNRVHFTPIKDTDKYSFADPLFFSDENGDYLFVEAINKTTKKGSLGVFDFTSGLGMYQDIIEEDFHLSYPLVFKWNGEYCLMPESNNAHRLMLYRAVGYPYRWELYKVLLEGIDCVDTTIYTPDSSSELFLLSYVKSYPNNKLVVFNLRDNGDVEKVSETEDTDLSLRGAGNIVVSGGKYYRPSQYCGRTYGQYVVFNEIERQSVVYNETPSLKLTPKDVVIDGIPDRLIDKVHTYSTGNGYEFIDFMHRRFSFIKPFKKLLKKINSKI